MPENMSDWYLMVGISREVKHLFSDAYEGHRTTPNQYIDEAGLGTQSSLMCEPGRNGLVACYIISSPLKRNHIVGHSETLANSRFWELMFCTRLGFGEAAYS